MLPEKISELDPSSSILFLGAGFSLGAKNIRGHDVPCSDGLRTELANILQVSPSAYTLETLVDEIHSRRDLNLHRTLYQLFTVSKLQHYHTKILDLPWRRIYTTNYDDAVEFHGSKGDSRRPSYTYDVPKPRKLQPGTIVHLHGAIRNTTEENLLTQIVLSENSYIRTHFEKSTWYDEFIRDLKFCDMCFFVGYSLRDYHISALLLQHHVYQRKTYFVTKNETDAILSRRLSPYGKILPIGIHRFAEICRNVSKSTYSGNLNTLKAFRYIDPLRDKKTLLPPTPIEVLNLVTYGTFNFDRCLSTLPKPHYIVPRDELIERAIRELNGARCLLVHSYVGNGKSIFLYILAYHLSEMGYRCVECRPNPIFSQKELDFLKTQGKIAVLMDSYDTAIDCIQLLAQEIPAAKFIVSIRTALQDVRLHEVQTRLPEPLRRISLNGMRKHEAEGFKVLLDRSGARVPMLEDTIDRCNDFREVVLSLYKNEAIRSKIQDALAPIVADRTCRKVFVAIHLLNWMGQYVDSSFLRAVTGSDAYVTMGKFPEISGDVFKLDDDRIQIRSPMFSEFLIQHHFETGDILDSVYAIIAEAVRRKESRHYQAILSSIMRFSNLSSALANDPDRLNALAELFSRLHRDIEVNREPLFWLQYSILMAASDNLKAAERFIGTAYSRSEDLPDFRTFQIDTFALRLYLRIECMEGDTPTVTRFEEIVDKLQKVRLMIWEESRRYHAIRVLSGIEAFVIARVKMFSGGERTAFAEYLGLLISDLEKLPADVQLETGSEEIRQGVNRARETVIRERNG